MKSFDKIKDKVEIALDSRQIWWLTVGLLAFGVAVFASGFLVGQRYPLLEVDKKDPAAALRLESLFEGPKLAKGPSSQLTETSFTYDEALAGNAGLLDEDPSLTLIAEHNKVKLATLQPLPEGVDPGELEGAMLEGKLQAAKGQEPTDTAKAEAKPAKPAVLAKKADDKKPDDKKPAAKKKAATSLNLAAIVSSPTAALDAAEAKISPTAAPPMGVGPAEDSGSKGKYTIQVRAFRNKKEALKYMAQLEAAGYNPYMVESHIEGKGTWYRVRIGKFVSMAAAADYQKKFEAKELIATFLAPTAAN